MTLVTKTWPVALLSTCHLVYAEAAPLLKTKLDALREKERVHFIIDHGSLGIF
ncbi:hypothetical protein EJ02DRAFT_455573 [Clathrospora elynae]|uniref:Uncharacterized protein n=1 Tax=Clathrospora elynae TaxID=706981 RepID=A0A6A5SMI3_9PLEO|nr:hypothetical protein EJ02DRAFT_455573 [Clathrospora elynae]